MKGEALTPFRVTTTLRFGIDGTSMIPFDFMSDADRWDLAFYVMGLRYADRPRERGVAPIALEEIAARSDVELYAELRRSGVADERLDGAVAELRLGAPYRAPPPSRRRGLGDLAYGLAPALLVALVLWSRRRAKTSVSG